MIKVYNTLTNQKEVFTPQNDHEVLMYVCGPTVYNYIHIGNARSAVAFDTVRRYLLYRGYHVNYVSNFTDVDDKIIKAANQENITPEQLSDKYIAAFYEDIDALNVMHATKNPRVKDNISAIIAFIKTLIEKGYAYQSGGDVYYSARKFSDYGKLSGQNIDDLEQGASQRLDDAEQKLKHDPLDFALWKAAKPGEIAWASPWGKGRPGWHIECSVMATKYLGKTIDIHAGGQDLEFPHHENEIAQSEANTGQKFAKYWLHNGFVTIGDDDEKMSKSLGNFVTVHELVKKIDPQVLRFFMASVQYRRPIRYSQANLAKAADNLNKLKQAYTNATFRLQDVHTTPKANAELTTLEAKFQAAMDDDFNVQNGLAVLYELAKAINIEAAKPEIDAPALQAMVAKLVELVEIFGVDLTKTSTTAGLDTNKIDAMVKQRDEARQNRDFALADKLRDELHALNIILEDTPQGTRWRVDDGK